MRAPLSVCLLARPVADRWGHVARIVPHLVTTMRTLRNEPARIEESAVLLGLDRGISSIKPGHCASWLPHPTPLLRAAIITFPGWNHLAAGEQQSDRAHISSLSSG
jgi:hypothetical protein